ncbi:MAG TPA: hypothetical protein VLR46_14815 [Candidatus Dormibacteraeota bacterium]|nr:hypothetical protein [Candidatus Dormibacteraeota bacterium]
MPVFVPDAGQGYAPVLEATRRRSTKKKRPIPTRASVSGTALNDRLGASSLAESIASSAARLECRAGAWTESST